MTAALHETRRGLSYPRGSLSSSMPTQVITEANKEVQQAVGTADGGKRGPYKQYSSTLHAEIAKYACQYGAAATTRHYSKQLEKALSESTVNGLTRNAAIFHVV